MATDIAARTTIAIRIGTNGEEPPLSSLAADCPPSSGIALPEPIPLFCEPPPGLPCGSVPPPAPPLEPDDEPPDADLPSEEPDEPAPEEDAEPPFALEEFAGGFDRFGISWLPVTVGGESEYWIPAEDSA